MGMGMGMGMVAAWWVVDSALSTQHSALTASGAGLRGRDVESLDAPFHCLSKIQLQLDLQKEDSPNFLHFHPRLNLPLCNPCPHLDVLPASPFLIPHGLREQLQQWRTGTGVNQRWQEHK